MLACGVAVAQKNSCDNKERKYSAKIEAKMREFCTKFSLTLLLVFWNARVVKSHFVALSNARQLTFDGMNVEPVFSPNGRFLLFQGSGTCYGTSCEQLYRLDLENPSKWPYRLSTGFGDTGSAAFCAPREDGAQLGDILYATTFHRESLDFTENSTSKSCPHICESERAKSDEYLRKLCVSSGTLWELKPDFDIFRINEWGNFKTQLTNTTGYDAEASVSPDGRWVVYTSMSAGTPDLWLMNAKDGSQKRRLTTWLGYKGRAQFSPDGQQIIFHASKPATREEVKRYRDLLHYNLVDVSGLNVFVFNLNDASVKQVTHFSERRRKLIASYPIFLPDGQHVMFSSNYNGNNRAHFRLFVTDLKNSSKIQQLTFHKNAFDTSPQLDTSGRQLVWASTTDAKNSSEVNLFVADLRVYGSKHATESQLHNEVFDKEEFNERQMNAKAKKFRTKKRVVGRLHFPNETHLTNVRQVTFGGQNAEGYFSFNDESIVLQAAGLERYGTSCDQIYRADFAPDFPDVTTVLQRLSTGLGACTCAYFFPDDKTSIHAATFAAVNTSRNVAQTCPPKKCTTQQAKTDPMLKKLCNTSYTWDLFPDYDIYKVNQYGNIIQRLTDTPGYDAEGAVSPDGQRIVFTSLRTGDPELWVMDADGGNLLQLTDELGYDGGPFFSPDGAKVGFRASRPKTPDEIKKYKQLLSYDLVEPLAMELYTVAADGKSPPRRITSLGGSNWAPFYLADNYHIIFSSNFNSTGFFGAFDLYVIGEDGSGLERVTYNAGGFDAFPMNSRSGKQLIWGSSRNGKSPMELNLFLADWLNQTVVE